MCLYLHGWIHVSKKAEPLWHLFLMVWIPLEGHCRPQQLHGNKSMHKSAEPFLLFIRKRRSGLVPAWMWYWDVFKSCFQLETWIFKYSNGNRVHPMEQGFGWALSCGCVMPCELHDWAGKERCSEHPDLWRPLAVTLYFCSKGSFHNTGID